MAFLGAGSMDLSHGSFLGQAYTSHQASTQGAFMGVVIGPISFISTDAIIQSLRFCSKYRKHPC